MGQPPPCPRAAPLELLAEVIGRYLTYLLREWPDLLPRVGELRGAVLRSWCGPDLLGHVGVLTALAEAAR